jgi:hypothetical protein
MRSIEYAVPHYAVLSTPSYLVPFSAPVPNTVSLCSSLSGREAVSPPYKKQEIKLYFCMLINLHTAG